jgi:hypothetical protein
VGFLVLPTWSLCGQDSAVDLLVALKTSPMTGNDEFIERALREVGVFPPSVMDRHYADKTELSKAEILLRSLEEMGMLSLSERDPRFGEKIRCIPILILELQLRLPDGQITTCGAFSDLGAGCCDICHTDPLHGMKLVELPGASMAWLCCAVDAASSPEPRLQNLVGHDDDGAQDHGFAEHTVRGKTCRHVADLGPAEVTVRLLDAPADAGIGPVYQPLYPIGIARGEVRAGVGGSTAVSTIALIRPPQN